MWYRKLGDTLFGFWFPGVWYNLDRVNFQGLCTVNASLDGGRCDLNGIRCDKYEIRYPDRAEAWSPNSSIYELYTCGSWV